MAALATKLRAEGIAKSYGAVQALAATDLDVVAGEFVTLLGPSGSGKTTLLMIVAGLTDPDQREICIDRTPAAHIPPSRRDIGMGFQRYAFFPPLTLFEHIAFPPPC